MPDPKEIWLQPWCDECERTSGEPGRLWCDEDVWGRCEAIDCDKPSVLFMPAGDG